MKLYQYMIPVKLVICLVFLFPDSLWPQYYVSNDWKLTTVGKVRQIILNRGRMSRNGNYADFPYLIGCEYPPGSGDEHINATGWWIGGIAPGYVKRVSVGAGGKTPDEFWPTEAPWDTIWVVNKGNVMDIGGTQADGTVDIYWPGYKAISDQDFVFRCNDYLVLSPSLGGNIRDPHSPLYLEVIGTVYTWSSPPLDEVIVWTFYIIPKKFSVEDVYFALQFGARVGPINKSPGADDRSLYFPEHKMVAHEDGPGGTDGDPAGAAIGFKLIPPPGLELILNYTFTWGSEALTRDKDDDRYDAISQNYIMENQEEYYGGSAYFSAGPFDAELGDTLKLQLAEILSPNLQGLVQRASVIDEVIKKDFKFPSGVPSPQLKTEIRSKEVHLSWYPTAEVNPETFTDPYRADGTQYPFEGYRLYKSTQTADGPWTLLGEYDIAGNEYGQNSGLAYEYTDIGLLNNIEYYYSVTSFSKPDEIFPWPSVESSIYQSVVEVILGPKTPETVGEVRVVPNPYRGDLEYSSYIPPWEKPPAGRDWMEQDRKIQFIHLPNKCEIKIYTLAGSYVAKILHDDPIRGYENWNMTSDVGQAIASGIYLFTVKDLVNGKGQVGKFVVIK
ncbi:hypothetical protein JXO59_00660 [candidate division KSB1 bacterium]|nr:hypothetical protein [candidate division KSB1 bacterium]